MVVGRDRELERIDALLAQACGGHAGSLLLLGGPGIGKTALLEAAAERAEGMRVLRTHGVESELELPFAALLELLRPLLADIGALPEPQACALREALALAPPSGRRDRLAVAAATMSLLLAAGEERPVLVLVDDAQWLDPSTQEALAVAARRLREASLAMLWSARPTLALEGLDRLELEPLEEAAAIELARDAAPNLEPALEPRLLELAGGNPLALLELPALLTRHAAAARPLDEPPPPGAVGHHLFGSRFEALPEDARLALLTAAAARTAELRVLTDSWARLGLHERAVEPAEREGLVVLDDGRLVFRHPLVRSLAYASASAPQRRLVHAALAEALVSDGGDERTWHRALATVAPDEKVAAALEQLARRAPTSAASADALLRAARLTPATQDRSRRLLEAASAGRDAGRFALARELASEALKAAIDPLQRARAEHLLVLVEEREPAALERLLAAAGRVAALAPEQAAGMLVDAIDLCASLGLTERGLQAAERAVALAATGGPELRLLAALRHSDATLWSGRPLEAERLAREAAAQAERDAVDTCVPSIAVLLAETLFSGMLIDRARGVCERAISVARREGALGTLRDSLDTLFSIEWTAGRVLAAALASAEELELAEAFGQPRMSIQALGHAAWAAAAQGREQDCRRLVAERYALAERLRPDPLLHPALGLLELGLGDAEAAVEALERTVTVRSGRGLPSAAQWSPDVALLVEAYLRAGFVEQATHTLVGFQAEAEESGRPFALALAWRCRGLLDADYDHAFARALAHHDRDVRKFEQARTRLLYGERLRRSKRRSDARGQLRNALAAFDQLGATLWSQRAQAELAATGERARRREPSSAAALTPQELQVARLVSSGLTNRDVAVQLFVTVNTIETHLRHVFQKLGVHSRTQLAHSFADPNHGFP